MPDDAMPARELADVQSAEVPKEYKTDAAAFYHDPLLWVISSPVDFTNQSVDFPAMRATVFQRRLDTGIEIKVTREGIFAFSFADWPPGTPPAVDAEEENAFELRARAFLNRTLVMNAFLALMYANEAKLGRYVRGRMIVTPELLISMRSLEEGGMGIASQQVSHLARSGYTSTYSPFQPPIMDDRILSRIGPPVSTQVIEKTADDLADVMRQAQEDGLLLLDLALRANKAYQDHNYSLCLITNWTVSEKLLQELWRRYQDDNRERGGKRFITTDRAKRLQDGRTFTAAVISEVLSLTGYLDYALYADICLVRKRRNDWMHSLRDDLSIRDAQRSADVCSKLLRQVRGIEFVPSLTLSIHG